MFDNKDNVWESAESDFPSVKREKRTLNFGIFDKYPPSPLSRHPRHLSGRQEERSGAVAKKHGWRGKEGFSSSFRGRYHLALLIRAKVILSWQVHKPK